MLGRTSIAVCATERVRIKHFSAFHCRMYSRNNSIFKMYTIEAFSIAFLQYSSLYRALCEVSIVENAIAATRIGANIMIFKKTGASQQV